VKPGYFFVGAYIGTIVAANWSIEVFGLVPVGFGLSAPAGVYFVGLVFWLRDIVQDTLGKRVAVVAILVGAALSAALSPALALASGVAFLVSELLDFAVYTPLRTRNLYAAVVASNAVGVVADSVVFLALAFGSLDYLAGQVIGKAWMTLLALFILFLHTQISGAAGYQISGGVTMNIEQMEPRELDAHLHRVVYGKPVEWVHVFPGPDGYRYDPNQEWDAPKDYCYPRDLGRWAVVPPYSTNLRAAFDLWGDVYDRAPHIVRLVRESGFDLLATRGSGEAAPELCRTIAWAYDIAAMVE
jgi:hypothetical protein